MKKRSDKPKKWGKKGTCPSCGVGTGSKHSKGCTFDYNQDRPVPPKTEFAIDICGDCANYGDCVEEKKFLCPYSLSTSEMKRRLGEWARENINKEI